MTRAKLHQQGFVSIIVAMILLVLISLITLGFAYLVRQNQRSALNRQLSTQAFYAAESGVNDAVKQISTIGDVTNCSDTATRVGNPQLDGTNVEYTCVLVNTRPDTLVYDSISTDASTVAHITTGGTTITSLQIAWQDTGPAANTNSFAPLGGGFKFPQKNRVCSDGSCVQGTLDFPDKIGVLRTTVIPADGAVSYDNTVSNSRNFFMFPMASNTGSPSSGTVSMTGADGVFGDGECSSTNTPRTCVVNINNVGSTDLFLRLRAIYKPVAATITAYNGSTRVPISGAQAIVDSTGRAQDVTRRIQVRVPLSPAYLFPEFAIESANTLCKRMTVWGDNAEGIRPNVGRLYDGTNPPNNASADDEACEIPGS